MTKTPDPAASETGYVFRKSDATLMLALIESSGTNKRGDRRGKRQDILCGKTSGSGIGAATSGTVYYREPTATGWADTTIPYTVYNIHPTASVAPSTIVLFCQVNGEWVVIYEAC